MLHVTTQLICRYVFTVWLVVTLLFVLLRLLPSNALIARSVDAGMTVKEIEEVLTKEGLNRPIGEQYIGSLIGFFSGQWGSSLKNGQPVSLIVLPRLQNSLGLVLSSFVIIIILGGLLTAFVSLHPNIIFRYGIDLYITLALSVPIYWTATIVFFLIYATQIGESRNPILPIIVLSVHVIGSLLRFSLTESHIIAHQPYIAYARAKGLSEGSIWLHHQLPMLLPRLLPFIGTQVVVLLGSTVAIETVFGRLGLGTLLLDAVLNRDYPVAQVTIGLLGLMSVSILTLTSWLSLMFDSQANNEL